MTTGRINQVTILTGPLSPRGSSGRERPEGRTGLLQSRSGSRPRSAWTCPCADPTPEHATGHPIAPTEFPKAWSAADAEVQARRRDPHCDMHTSRGGYQPPVTPEGGYELRLTPECVVIMIAIGQSSTDSVRARGLPHKSSGAPRPASKRARPEERTRRKRSVQATHPPSTSQPGSRPGPLVILQGPRWVVLQLGDV